MHENTIIAISAPKGLGKSTLTRAIVREQLKAGQRVTILDAHGEYGPEGDDPIAGCEVAWDTDPSVRLLLKVHKQPHYCVSLRTADDDATIAKVWPMLWDMPDQWLIIEEASRFCSPSALPPEVARVLRFGRHRGLSQVWVTQRPSSIHRDVTANADLVVAFRQSEPRDLQYLAARGMDVEHLKRLPDYRILCVGDLRKAPLAVAGRMEPAQKRAQIALDLDEGSP